MRARGLSLSCKHAGVLRFAGHVVVYAYYPRAVPVTVRLISSLRGWWSLHSLHGSPRPLGVSPSVRTSPCGLLWLMLARRHLAWPSLRPSRLVSALRSIFRVVGPLRVPDLRAVLLLVTFAASFRVRKSAHSSVQRGPTPYLGCPPPAGDPLVRAQLSA